MNIEEPECEQERKRIRTEMKESRKEDGETVHKQVEEKQVLVKTLTGKAITIGITPGELTHDFKINIGSKIGMTNIMNRVYMTHIGRNIGDDELEHNDIQKGDKIHMRFKVKGGAINPEEIKASFSRMEAQMQKMQAQLTQEQARSAELKDILDRKSAPSSNAAA